MTGITKDINLGLDLQGGFEILYEATAVDEGQEITDDFLNTTVRILEERVNTLGISEPDFQIEENNRIRVKLAGIDDQDKARELLATSARLSFRDYQDKEYLDGNDIVPNSAKQDFGTTNNPVVTLQLKDAAEFADVTRTISSIPEPNNVLVIWMDFEEGDSYQEESQNLKPKYASAASVDQVLNTTGVEISGMESIEAAQDLADVINAGSLPVNLTEKFSTSVGAQFGQQALDKTVLASIIGVALIFLFMIGYYRFPGVIAVVTLSIYIYLILLVFWLMHGVLTLPGIAALVLGVGMAVDANIITYERIKDELRSGKNVQAAFKAGNQNSLSTIFDGNITTLIAATVLFIFGTSSVKGFATLLIISICVSFITAVYGSRLLLGLWVKSKFLNKRPGWFGVKPDQIQSLAKNEELEPKVMGRQFDFVKNRKKFFTLSIVLVLAGVICLSIFRLNLGIDFISGSRVEILTDSAVNTEEIEEDLAQFDLVAKKVSLSGDNNEIAVARFDTVLPKETISEMQTYFSDKYGSNPNVSTVSPEVGKELARNAALAVLYASIGIILYVTIRFEIYFAVAAIIALLHDAFFILAIFSITRVEFDITIIAAILTIVGYSINDTIVTFDRIRENLKLKKRVRSFKELAAIVNRSLMQTLARSINTVLTVVFAALMLLIFGATSITGFSFALIIGLLAGTYSSLFIASQLWLVSRGRNIKDNPINYIEKKQTGGPQV